jgi:hypothetical protein
MTARIYQKIENSMQRGRGNANVWLLEHDVPYAWKADPLMGWQGSGDTRGQIALTFLTAEAAVAYAEREGLDYRVVSTPKRSLIIQSYADNFK